MKYSLEISKFQDPGILYTEKINKKLLQLPLTLFYLFRNGSLYH